ncbi:hypothetical protein NIIDMKKI_65070 [Mycobacterium kansasii]|uniref:RES domain-containing protein n=1 Tax=Mycobacterium kansasii TaxID=1768 RepID=A0A7G1IJW3_MYCKA|nr:hypothetical protein NIIDMKKI_65070 [Mycobacterium kansasii]
MTRRLQVGVLHGTGLRRLKVTAADLTSSPASSYASTVLWAEAAHDAGLDGLVWMSRQCNDAKAYVFFGDRCAGAVTQDPTHARIFAGPADQIWLIDRCAPCTSTCSCGLPEIPPAGPTNRSVPTLVSNTRIQARFGMTVSPHEAIDTAYFDVVIVGAGISGLGAAYRLLQRNPGLSYTILERRERIGGTWDLFRYPGCAPTAASSR